jgi:hypothetical protein
MMKEEKAKSVLNPGEAKPQATEPAKPAEAAKPAEPAPVPQPAA